MEPGVNTKQHIERASLVVQLLCPPLPIVCVGSNGEEKITSSHDLLSSMIGRLVCVPDEKFVGACKEV